MTRTIDEMMLSPQECDTVRSDCEQARTSYRPDWSASQPWVTYQRGTAGRHFGTLGAAIEHLRGKGFKFTLE